MRRQPTAIPFEPISMTSPLHANRHQSVAHQLTQTVQLALHLLVAGQIQTLSVPNGAMKSTRKTHAITPGCLIRKLCVCASGTPTLSRQGSAGRTRMSKRMKFRSSMAVAASLNRALGMRLIQATSKAHLSLKPVPQTSVARCATS